MSSKPSLLDHGGSPRHGSREFQPLLTLPEIARMLRLSERTIRRLVVAQRMPCVRIGRALRFVPADVFRFVSARKE